VVGHYQGRHNCLKIVMAHTDTVPAAPGADDNASGVGILVALAPRLARIRPYCDVWLAATGAEERPYTGHRDHLGSRRLVKHLRHRRSARRLRYALSVDMVGRGAKFQLRSPRSGTRPRVEGQLLRAGRQRDVTLRWLRDSSSGNSDHREFELAGLPALTIQVWGGIEACWHQPCDTWRRLQPGSLDRVQDIVEIALRRR
jgi:Zn-dependent M28 family amino/carboxypeptidase